MCWYIDRFFSVALQQALLSTQSAFLTHFSKHKGIQFINVCTVYTVVAAVLLFCCCCECGCYMNDYGALHFDALLTRKLGGSARTGLQF